MLLLLLLMTFCLTIVFAKQDQGAPKLNKGNGEFLYYDMLNGEPYTSTYDERSFFINGQRTLLLGGSVHYPRFSPGQWDDILSKMRNDGLNHAEVYVFWNIHEPTYDFSGNHKYSLEGRANLTKFLETAAKNGLFVNLRIGPYVCAEWSFGGLPVWLLHVDGISFRDNNGPWEDAMSTFVNWVAEITEPYLAKNGGPIILAQIENEYHGSGDSAAEYVNWCGNYAASLNFDIPWIMCNGESANNTVNTCNGNDCYDSYLPTHGSKYAGQPLGWTENEGWFQYWAQNGGNTYVANETGWANRSPQDMAFVVSKWFAGGASHHNYYMYFGGNHVSWTAGSAITSYYADGVNYHSDCLANEPKKSHLTKLHLILAQNQRALLEDNIQYGHEIHLNGKGPNGTTFDLVIDNCDSSKKLQRFLYNGDNNNLLQLTNGQYCAVSTGSSNPVEMVTCNKNSNNQKWTYDDSNGLQIKSMDSGKCLDIYGDNGPNIDEYQCKDPTLSDAANQQWYYNSTTQMFISKYDNSKCLTAQANKTNTFAYVYESRNTTNHNDNNGYKVTFLVNVDSSIEYTVEWEGVSYVLPSQSVSIIDSSGEELFNSAKVDTTDLPSERIYKVLYSGNNDLTYKSWNEYVPLTNNNQNRSDMPVYHSLPYEQIRFSNNTSEYLYYSTNVKTDFSSLNCNNLEIRFEGQKANAYNVWFNDEFIDTNWDGSHDSGQLNFTIDLANSNITTNCGNSDSTCVLTILSSNLGIHNGINNQHGSDDQDKKGLSGRVWLYDKSLKQVIDDYTDSGWNHWIGSTGENLNVTGSGENKISWNSPTITSNPMTWYQTTFETPDMSLFYQNNHEMNSNSIAGVLLLDIGKNGKGIQRGHWWLNGKDMGHYNNVIQTDNVMVQQYYFIPLDYLMAQGQSNSLVFEEELPLSGTNSLTNVNIVYSTFVIPQN